MGAARIPLMVHKFYIVYRSVKLQFEYRSHNGGRAPQSSSPTKLSAPTMRLIPPGQPCN